jgi:spermidine/putrescine transport system ATP-binding protein
MSDFTPTMVQRSGTIVSTSYHGATTQYLVSVSDGVTLTVLEQNLPSRRADDRWHAGDRVQLGWLPEHAVVLT